MATAADCAACHTAPGGNPLPAAGPSKRRSAPYSHRTSRRIWQTGIGGWTDDQFVDAVRNGIGHGGIHLYPAMPYTYYTKMTREDVIAIRAYLDTVQPVRNEVHANQLPFPFNQREAMLGWNELYFRPGEFKPDPGKSAEWNRGAYLVEGAEHCGLCHTPKNVMGGDENGQAMQGSVLQNWYAPNITGNRRVGLGDWTVDDIALYLKTGRNRYDIASGPMADAVTHSTSHLTDADLRGDRRLSEGPAARWRRAAAAGLCAGSGNAAGTGMIYNERCAACHTVAGQGIVGLFPRLSGGPLVQQSQATSLIRVVLEGSRAVATEGAPTGPAMPSFAWELSDADVAAVVTYIRNAWGNAAPAVSAGDVANMRQTLHRPGRSALTGIRSAVHDQSHRDCDNYSAFLGHARPCARRQPVARAPERAPSDGHRADRHDVRRQQRQPSTTARAKRVLGTALGRPWGDRQCGPCLGCRRRSRRHLARGHHRRGRALMTSTRPLEHLMAGKTVGAIRAISVTRNTRPSCVTARARARRDVPLSMRANRCY